MTDTEAQYLASLNPINSNPILDGYLRSYNSVNINSALRALYYNTSQIEKAIHTIENNKSIIFDLDKATSGNVFTKETDVYRMVDFDFLEGNFSIKNSGGLCYDRIISAYNLLSEEDPSDLKFYEPGFTSCSYKEFGSEHCRNYPIELIIHCNPGQTYFQTTNFKESEIILPRNITFHVYRYPEVEDTTYGKKIVIKLYIE